MTPSTTLRLALAGSRTDTIRVALTAISAGLATLTLLAAATVAGGSALNRRYELSVLSTGSGSDVVVMSLLALTIPVLTLAAQCARLGAPARDRRLAAFRLAGATPRQVMIIAAAETGLASLLGSGAGLLTYVATRTVAHRPDTRGLLAVPTDVRLAWWLIVALCLVGPLLSFAIATVLLRRVVIGPFGLARRARPGPPDWWPAILLIAPMVFLVAVGPRAWLWSYLHIPGPFREAAAVGAVLGCLVFVCVGVGASAAWITYASGRALRAVARRPSTLVAAGRLMDDPWAGSRTFGTLLVAVLLGACTAAMRVFYSASMAVRRVASARDNYASPPTDEGIFTIVAVLDLAVAVAIVIAAGALLVALVERALAHRRTYAALVAGGIPRSVLARAAVWQVAVPFGPALLLALVAGTGFVRLATGAQLTASLPGPVGGPSLPSDQDYIPTEMTVALPVPWHHLAVIGGGAVLAVLTVVAMSLLFLRTSTDVTELRTT